MSRGLDIEPGFSESNEQKMCPLMYSRDGDSRLWLGIVRTVTKDTSSKDFKLDTSSRFQTCGHSLSFLPH